MDSDDDQKRLREIESKQAVQGEQIGTFKITMEKLGESLDKLLTRVDRFEKMFVAGVFLIFSGTMNGNRALEAILKVFGF